MAVLDVMLPDGDGFTLFNQINSMSKIPIIFLTAKQEVLVQRFNETRRPHPLHNVQLKNNNLLLFVKHHYLGYIQV